MKKILALFFILSFVSCKTNQPVLTNDPTGDFFEVRKGQKFEIRFITNASMGLSWILTNQDTVSVVIPQESRYESTAPKDMVGAASERYWMFQAVKKGTDTLRFDYCRGGDPSTSVKSRTVVVKVR